MTQKPHPMLEKLRAKQRGLDVSTRAARRFPTAEEHDARKEAKGRLPNLSAYTKWWDQESQLWHGQLTVHVNGEHLTFTAHSPGSFRLEHKLDDLYRAWLISKPRPTESNDESLHQPRRSGEEPCITPQEGGGTGSQGE